MQIELRPWAINDLDVLIKLANNKNIAQYMADAFPYPYTFETGKTFIEFATTRNI